MNGKIEVLAPAGGMESIYAAVRCGADAVYVGGKDFSARASAANFTDEELKEAADYCHLHGVKLYRAMNTIVFDSEAEIFMNAVRYTALAGADGLIIQDIGAAALARAAAPDMPLHASTQMTIHTPAGALVAKELGFKRIVAARELTLDGIRRLCGTGIEVEVFVHGAQCMCVSGQCYMSAVIGSRSANRGRCAQACRLPFSAAGHPSEDTCCLSLKDMSYVEHIHKLIDAGAASLKIEGRMKRAEYTAAAVTAVRHAVDGKNSQEDLQRLKAVFSRSGFTDGYIRGKLGAEMFGIRRREDVVSARDVLPELAGYYKDETKIGSIDFTCRLTVGEPAVLDYSVNGGSISGTVSGDIVSAAVNRPTGPEDIRRQLSKLGGTAYECGSIVSDISGDAVLPASGLNLLRRRAVWEADNAVIRKNTPVYMVSDNTAECAKRRVGRKRPDVRIICRSAELAKKLTELIGSRDRLILPLAEYERCKNADERMYIMLPRLIKDEKPLAERLASLAGERVSVWCDNPSHIRLAKDCGMTAVGGAWLNISNSFACSEYAAMGLKELCISPELKAAQIRALGSPVPIGVYAYGRMPLMLTANCPIRAAMGCAKCTGFLTDRTGRRFPMRCCDGYTELLNSDLLNAFDMWGDFSGADFALIDLPDDITAEDAAEIIGDCKACRRRAIVSGKYTRGLYVRGVI